MQAPQILALLIHYELCKERSFAEFSASYTALKPTKHTHKDKQAPAQETRIVIVLGQAREKHSPSQHDVLSQTPMPIAGQHLGCGEISLQAFSTRKELTSRRRTNFVVFNNDTTKRNSLKLKEGKLGSDVRKKYFLQRAVRSWGSRWPILEVPKARIGWGHPVHGTGLKPDDV